MTRVHDLGNWILLMLGLTNITPVAAENTGGRAGFAASPVNHPRAGRHASTSPTIWVGSMGPDGFAALPITTLDPPHSAASPVVPAFVGSGSPSPSADRSVGAFAFSFRERTELAEIFPAVLPQPGYDFGIAKQLSDVAARHRQVQRVEAVGFLE